MAQAMPPLHHAPFALNQRSREMVGGFVIGEWIEHNALAGLASNYFRRLAEKMLAAGVDIQPILQRCCQKG